MRSSKAVRRPHTTTTSTNQRKAHSKAFKAQRNQMKQWIASAVLSEKKPAPIVLSETVHTPIVKVVETAQKKAKPQKKEAVKPAEKKAKSKPEKKPEPKVEKKAEPKAEKKTEAKVEKKAEPKAEKKAEPKVEKKPEPKAEKKPEPKVEKKPEPKAEKKPEPKAEKKPEPVTEKKPEPVEEKKSAPIVEKEIEEKIEIKTQTSLESQNDAKLDEKTKIVNNQASKAESGKKDKKKNQKNKAEQNGSVPKSEQNGSVPKAEQNGSVPKANGVAPKQPESPVQVCEITSSVSDKENLSDSDSTEKVENRQPVKADKKLLENVQKLATQFAAKVENQLDPQTKLHIDAQLYQLSQKIQVADRERSQTPVLNVVTPLPIQNMSRPVTPTMRERIHKLLPQDILFCSRLIDKHGDNFEAMVKDPNNTYRENARSLQRKIRIFKESPHYQQYLESKNNSVPLEQLLSQQAV